MSNPTERLKWFVMERAVKHGRFDVTAAFETSIAASDYARYLRSRATNPEWDCFFVHSTNERVREMLENLAA